MSARLLNTLMISVLVVLAVTMQASYASAEEVSAEEGRFIKLHETRWSVDGKPILGAYGAPRVEDLRRVKDAGMNIVFAGDDELDSTTPVGAFCLENDIKVVPHVTSFLYHGVSLRDAITPDQTTIPLHFKRGRPKLTSRTIQIDDEIIRYEEMTDTELVNCERGSDGTRPAAHREGIILLWPEAFRAEIERIKDSPNLFGYYVLDDSPGDAVSALRAMYKVIREVDPNLDHPVCAGFGDAGSVTNFVPGVCDIMFIYWYPVSTTGYHREQTAYEVQYILSAARQRVPGIPFVGIYQAFDGGPASTGQGVPTADQLREQMEDFVREGASGLVSFICHNDNLPGWADLETLGAAVKKATEEILETGGLEVRPETAAMKRQRLQPKGHWEHPLPLSGYAPAWHVLAAFEDTDNKMLDVIFPPDQGFDPTGVYPARSGSAGWRIREATLGTLGLSQLYGVGNTVAYAYCEVTTTEKRDIQMHICTDDDAWVRLNGEEVYRFDGSRGLDLDRDIVPLTLPNGTSRIDVKSYNRGGMWAFFIQFTDTAGRPIEDLKFSPSREAAAR